MKRSGFTLIELSIVLIVIGLIIGGIMKGKDLVGGADQKKIYNTWVKQWVVTANAYQDRTGGLLADGANNGGTEATENGRCDNVNLATSTTVQDKLKAIGLDQPISNVAGSNGGSYNIKGKYFTSVANAYFYWLASTTDGSKNRLYITGMPVDVAISFDKMTDGQIDGRTGDFRIYPDGQDWPDASTTNTVNVSLAL